MSALAVSTWVVTGFLAFLYLMVGSMKLAKPTKAQDLGPTMAAQSKQKIRFIGGAEVLGAVGIVLPAAIGVLPWVSGVAAVGLIAIQALAIPAHVKHHDTKGLPFNALLLTAAAFVALVRTGAIP